MSHDPAAEQHGAVERQATGRRELFGLITLMTIGTLGLIVTFEDGSWVTPAVVVGWMAMIMALYLYRRRKE